MSKEFIVKHPFKFENHNYQAGEIVNDHVATCVATCIEKREPTDLELNLPFNLNRKVAKVQESTPVNEKNNKNKMDKELDKEANKEVDNNAPEVNEGTTENETPEDTKTDGHDKKGGLQYKDKALNKEDIKTS
jgi:hypothetical protein